MTSFDALVLGAGAAGLAAAEDLAAAGLSVLVLEARRRVGGRLWTLRPPGEPPVELGAEFVHGRPRAAWDVIEARGLRWVRTGERAMRRGPSGLRREDAYWDRVSRVLRRLERETGRDRSFAAFAAGLRSPAERRAAEEARGFVEGFHAADAALIGIKGLGGAEGAEESWRLVDGYDGLLPRPGPRARVRLGAVVQRLCWLPGRVEARGLLRGRAFRHAARAAVVALPLGVLQAPGGAWGAVSFSPPLDAKRRPLSRLVSGAVAKVVLGFRERFWEKAGGEAAFAFADGEPLPTWWTQRPLACGLLTGWAGGPRARRFLDRPPDLVAYDAARCAARVFGAKEETALGALTMAAWHDWQADPFARGAYSYAGVGGHGAQRELARPLSGTLFFAGEATDWKGEHGTVAGALASGRRAARELLSARRR